MKLTPRVVAGLAKEKIAQERIVWDDELSGLGLRMRPGGSRNWVYQYKLGTKQRRITLGALSALGLVKARQTMIGTPGISLRKSLIVSMPSLLGMKMSVIRSDVVDFAATLYLARRLQPPTLYNLQPAAFLAG